MQEQKIFNENFLKNQDFVNQLVLTVDDNDHDEFGQRKENSKETQKVLKKI